MKQNKTYFAKIEFESPEDTKTIVDEIRRLSLKSDVIHRLLYSRVAQHDLREVKKTRREIEDVIEEALNIQSAEGERHFPYEEGVIQALEWVLGIRGSSPLELVEVKVETRARKGIRKLVTMEYGNNFTGDGGEIDVIHFGRGGVWHEVKEFSLHEYQQDGSWIEKSDQKVLKGMTYHILFSI